MKRGLIFLFLLLFLVSSTLAASGRMTLLAVSERDNLTSGSTADLFLETRQGSGRVFLDTFPLTKLDTQISTRFAKEIGCDYFALDCSKTDFIYTIRSNSNIVGGPSAGAAISALTVSILANLSINKDVAVTGTINSGGLIGPVGGLKEKIRAAAKAGIKTVIISKGSVNASLIKLGESLGVSVVEVDDLNELLFYFSGKFLAKNNYSITPDNDYLSTMQLLSKFLCNRTSFLRERFGQSLNSSVLMDLDNHSARVVSALNSGNAYSAASFCFGDNIFIKSIAYKDLSEVELLTKLAVAEKNAEKAEEKLRARKLETVTDLQTFVIVLDRIQEALDRVKENSSDALAYSEERLVSAESWSAFFKVPGEKFILDESVLKVSCQKKLQEAQERQQYVSIYVPDVNPIIDAVRVAENNLQQGDYALCLIRASEAKAKANAILSTIGVPQNRFSELLDSKIKAIELQIAKTVSKRAFPILSYSYFQYAKSLRGEDEISALLFSEYALESSNLDIYFKDKKSIKVLPKFHFDSVASWLFILILAVFVLGYLTGKSSKKGVFIRLKR